MRGIVRAGLCLAALWAALTTGIQGASAYGAIAANGCGRWGYSHGFGSRAEAFSRAMRECGTQGCKIVASVHNACGALATDGTTRCGAQGYGAASTRAQAESIALVQCARYGGRSCTVRAWVCDR